MEAVLDRRRVAAILFLGGAALGGCSEEALTRVLSDLTASPEALDFGEGCIGDPSVANIEVTNIGRAPAVIVALEISPTGAPFTADPPSAPIAAGASVLLPVTFSPSTPRERSEARLSLTAEDGAELTVALTGVGGLRRLEVSAERVDFGVVNEGEAAVRALQIRNVGGSPLTVSEVVWTSTSTDLTLSADAFLGGAIGSKAAATVELRYEPTDVGDDRGRLIIFSDDPERPRLEVPVVARANLRPIVELYGCRRAGPEGRGCAPEEARTSLTAGLDQTIYLDGRQARDPEGGELTLTWSTPLRPDGSIAAVFEDAQVWGTGNILIDREGGYVVRLIARDRRGLESLPSEITIDPRDLEVEMAWDLATDVDLHLVRPGGQVGDYGSGAPGRSRGSDCSAFNRAPDWGQPGSDVDDPRLDRDAVSTSGPETAGLDRPEPGSYRVYGHYCDSRDVRVPTLVRLLVKSRGRVVSEFGPVPLEPGDLWPAALLTWDPENETLDASATRAPIENRPDICRTD